MLEKEVLDAVVIATPTIRHFEDVSLCISAGCKHIFVEKPIAASDDEAAAITYQAEQAGCSVLVAHQRHYYPGKTADRDWGDWNAYWGNWVMELP